jgi:epoxide hydrolase-like predicted phosphatase
MSNDWEAVIFDFGGVLMRTANPIPRAELEARFGLGQGGAEEIVFGNPLWDEAQLGRITSAQFWADVGRRLGLQDPDEFSRQFWSGDRLDGELVELIKYLRHGERRTALLSNGPASLIEFFHESGISDLFDVVVVSACEGVMKPDRAIYELTLNRLGVRPEQAVFVDDLRENVRAAQDLGIGAVRFRGLAPLRRSLREMGMRLPERIVQAVPVVRAVMFDWGGVIEGLPEEELIAEVEERLGLQSGLLAEALWGSPWRQLSVGAISEQEYDEQVTRVAGISGTADLARIKEELYGTHRLRMELIDAVRALRSQYRAALVSNAWLGQADSIRERFGLDVEGEFDVYVNSAWVGLRKPDPAIFQLALSELDVEPGEAILVDDLQRNIDSARQLGIHTVHFFDPQASLAELEALLGHAIALSP